MIQNRSNKGNWYNLYSQKHTNEYDDITYNDKKTKKTKSKKSTENKTVNGTCDKDDDGVLVKLLA